MNYRTDLNLGEVVYKSFIFHIPVFWINLLNDYDFFFDGGTLQTSHTGSYVPLPISEPYFTHVTALEQSEGRISFKMTELIILHLINTK